MKKTAQDFYLLFCNHKFKKVSETIQDGFSGMYFVLRILAEAGKDLFAGDISDIFKVSTARTAVILNTLEKKGFVFKSKSDVDARKTVVRITESGQKILEDRKNRIFTALDKFLAKLNEEETQQFYNILNKLLTN